MEKQWKRKKRKTNENKQRTKEKSCILEVPNPAKSKLTKIIWVRPPQSYWHPIIPFEVSLRSFECHRKSELASFKLV